MADFLEVPIDVRQFAQDLFADKNGVDSFIVMGQEVSEPGNFGKFISKARVDDMIVTQDVECFRVGLRETQVFVPDHQFCQNNAPVGDKIKVVQQGASIDGVERETLQAFVLDCSHQP